MIDIEKMKQAALAATQGEWDSYETKVYLSGAAGGFDIGCSPNAEANADFIATANPSAVLELITRLEAAEQDAADYLSTDEPTAYPIRKKLFTHPAPSAPGTGSEIASKLKLLAMNWCNEHAQPVVCGSLNQKELYALIDQVCIGVDSPPSAPEGWQQFSHTLKYLIGTWRDGKGMFPQESDKYDESIAAAHLLLKEADWQQGRYFPILAAARNEKKLQESAPTETYIHEHTKLPHPGYFGIPKGYWQWALQYHQAMLIEEAKTTPQYPRNDLSAGGLNQIIADRNQP